MKIIKKGKRAKLRVICKECDAVLEITRKDLSLASNLDEPGKTLYQITCPCCKKKIYFREDKLTGIL